MSDFQINLVISRLSLLYFSNWTQDWQECQLEVKWNNLSKVVTFSPIISLCTLGTLFIGFKRKQSNAEGWEFDNLPSYLPPPLYFINSKTDERINLKGHFGLNQLIFCTSAIWHTIFKKGWNPLLAFNQLSQVGSLWEG